jgi:hypothetical protein
LRFLPQPSLTSPENFSEIAAPIDQIFFTSGKFAFGSFQDHLYRGKTSDRSQWLISFIHVASFKSVSSPPPTHCQRRNPLVGAPCRQPAGREHASRSLPGFVCTSGKLFVLGWLVYLVGWKINTKRNSTQTALGCGAQRHFFCCSCFARNNTGSAIWGFWEVLRRLLLHSSLC